MAFLIRVLINGVAIWLATILLSGLDVVGYDSDWEHVAIIALIALVFGVVNAIVKPIVAFLSIPLYILTLGLFTLVVNALMLMLTAWVTEFTDWGLRIDDFWTAVLGGLIISVVSFGLSLAIPESRRG
ncbi:MAG: phage holin family protein [Brevundimonas sp.]